MDLIIDLSIREFCAEIDKPTCLLPVGNEPMVSYVLKFIKQCKYTFNHVVVTVDAKEVDEIKTYLESELKDTRLFFVIVDEYSEDMLLKCKDHLVSKDFVIIPGNLLIEGHLHNLMDLHRLQDSLVTILYNNEDINNQSKQRKKKEKDVKLFKFYPTEKLINNLVGVQINDEDDLFYKANFKEGNRELFGRAYRVIVNEKFTKTFTVSKNLLKKNPKMTLHTNYKDLNLYILNRNLVFDVLENNDQIKDIQNELIPFIVNLQFRDNDSFPDYIQKNRYISDKKTKSYTYNLVNSKLPTHQDFIRVFAMELGQSGTYCTVINNLHSYHQANIDISCNIKAAEDITPWPTPASKTPGKFKGALLGQDCKLGDKVSIKNSVIGDNCQIDTKAKINNCIIMNNVTIHGDVVIQNSIVCSNVIINEKSNINECLIGFSTDIEAESKKKSEIILSEN